VIYVFESYALDSERRELWRGNNLVALEPQVFDLLQYLIRNRERVVSKDDLIATVWNGRVVSESALSSRITAVRHAVGDSGEGQHLVRTIPRKGFRFIGPVREQTEPNEEFAPKITSPTNLATTPDPKRFLSRMALRVRWLWLGGAGAVLAVVGVASWYISFDSRALSNAARPPLTSVAIMPLASASTSVEDEHFAAELTQDLTSAAARGMRSALVVSQGLAAKYKGRSIDPQEVGRDLNVGYLLEGEVRKAAGSIVVMARLVEIRNGLEVWGVQEAGAAISGSETLDATVARLTNRLREAVYEAERKRVTHLPIASASAAELALRADVILDEDPSTKGRREARELYEEARRLDPASIPAVLGLYWMTRLQLQDDPGVDHEGKVKELDDLSLRAVNAARDDPRVWHIRQDALSWQWRWEGAFEANAEALRIDPYRNIALRDRAWLLILTGRAEEALPLLDRAIALDPRGGEVPWCLQFQCMAHIKLGDYDDGIAACEKALAFGDYWPRYLYLVAAYAQKGDLVKAGAAKVELLNREPGLSITRLRALRTSNNPIFWQQMEDHIFPGLRKAGIPEQ
jgi:DNA-binding winged helix-turn-helix (wHTH) protein/TolB-like protein/tetratricopeptide (TPR) repeat protein